MLWNESSFYFDYISFLNIISLLHYSKQKKPWICTFGCKIQHCYIWTQHFFFLQSHINSITALQTTIVTGIPLDTLTFWIKLCHVQQWTRARPLLLFNCLKQQICWHACRLILFVMNSKTFSQRYSTWL